jgi:hypothetical protein
MKSFTPKLVKLLRKHGCEFIRHGKGDHSIWYSPITKQKLIVDGAIPSRHTANSILKAAGITHKF